MTSGVTFWGLSLLWIGAVSLGALVIMRTRWEQAAAGVSKDGAAVPALPKPHVRKTLEAVLLFSGTGGSILGVGLLCLGFIR